MWEYANGIDNAEVVFTMQKPKCVGNSTTVSQDINDLEKIEEVLLALTEHTTYRLRKIKMLGNVVSVQLRTSEFKNYSHQRKLDFSNIEICFSASWHKLSTLIPINLIDSPLYICLVNCLATLNISFVELVEKSNFLWCGNMQME